MTAVGLCRGLQIMPHRWEYDGPVLRTITHHWINVLWASRYCLHYKYRVDHRWGSGRKWVDLQTAPTAAPCFRWALRKNWKQVQLIESTLRQDAQRRIREDP